MQTLCGLSLPVMSESEHRLLSMLVWVGLYLPSPIPGPFSAFSVSREGGVGQTSIDWEIDPRGNLNLNLRDPSRISIDAVSNWT